MHNYLILVNPTVVFAFVMTLVVVPSQILQNLKVSSAEALTSVDPSGEIDTCKTLCSCPNNSATEVILGYFHITREYFENPCADIISLVCFDQVKAET